MGGGWGRRRSVLSASGTCSSYVALGTPLEQGAILVILCPSFPFTTCRQEQVLGAQQRVENVESATYSYLVFQILKSLPYYLSDRSS